MADKDSDIQKNLLIRLRRIEGQVRGIQRMVADENNCAETLNQITAIKAALNRVALMIFETHAHECIIQTLGNEPDQKDLDEIITMMGRLLK
ncbi:MAG: metal-sensitive transcriptional regulator [Deltaproteobacteria bacterium]